MSYLDTALVLYSLRSLEELGWKILLRLDEVLSLWKQRCELRSLERDLPNKTQKKNKFIF